MNSVRWEQTSVKNKVLLDGPIPGQSLTAEPGSRAWERPPRFSTVEDTIDFYIENITSNPKKMTLMMEQIEDGAPLTLIADSMQILGVSKGLHSLDVGILVTPVLIEFMKALAESEGIDYVVGVEENRLTDEEDTMLANQAVKSVFGSAPSEETMNEVEQEQPEEDSEVKRGLMAPKRMMESEEDGV